MTKVSLNVSEAIYYPISSVIKGLRAKNKGILLTVRVSEIKIRINLFGHLMKKKSRIWLEETTAMELGFINNEYLKLSAEQKDKWLEHFVAGHSFWIQSDIGEEIEDKEKKLMKRAQKEQKKQMKEQEKVVSMEEYKKQKDQSANYQRNKYLHPHHRRPHICIHHGNSLKL